MAEKLYYSMGEVAEMFDVNPSLIRHWESQFSVLRPKRNKKGNRLFTPQDVENLKRIYHLVKECGMTLDGAKRALRNQPSGDAAAREAMVRYAWPGNLREMKNLVKRATLLARGPLIRLEDLGPDFLQQPDAAHLQLRDGQTEAERIRRALQATGGNKSRAAQLLGVDRKTLYNKLKLYGMGEK